MSTSQKLPPQVQSASRQVSLPYNTTNQMAPDSSFLLLSRRLVTEPPIWESPNAGFRGEISSSPYPADSRHTRGCVTEVLRA